LHEVDHCRSIIGCRRILLISSGRSVTSGSNDSGSSVVAVSNAADGVDIGT
jgi:hypothetical protein